MQRFELSLLKVAPLLQANSDPWRRKRCLEIYDRYVESPEKVLAGIVEGMELTALADLPKRMAGYRCSKAEADALACNPL